MRGALLSAADAAAAEADVDNWGPGVGLDSCGWCNGAPSEATGPFAGGRTAGEFVAGAGRVGTGPPGWDGKGGRTDGGRDCPEGGLTGCGCGIGA